MPSLQGFYRGAGSGPEPRAGALCHVCAEGDVAKLPQVLYNSHGVREQIGKENMGMQDGRLPDTFLSWDKAHHTRSHHSMFFLESRLPDPGADSFNTEPVP